MVRTSSTQTLLVSHFSFMLVGTIVNKQVRQVNQ
jgi:hypothetical protein